MFILGFVVLINIRISIIINTIFIANITGPNNIERDTTLIVYKNKEKTYKLAPLPKQGSKLTSISNYIWGVCHFVPHMQKN